MKRALWIIPLVLAIAAGCASYGSSAGAGYPPGPGSAAYPGDQQYSGGPQGYGPNEDTSYFFNSLSPYGDWVDYNPYGYVWVPRHMGYNWRPYSDGHWVWTDYGWTWISDEVWGDICFHYGRWGMDNDMGWYWVPGTEWGPAWVTWRFNDQYLGWAPIPPGVHFRAGIDFNAQAFNIPFNFWIFIQGSHFQDREINTYILPYERNRTIVNYTTIRTNIYVQNDRIVNEGITPDQVRRLTGRNVPKYGVQNAPQPGRARVVGQEVRIFRPAIRENEAARPKAFLNRDQARQELAPAKVFEPRPQQPVKEQAAAVQKKQAEEKRLLQKTQAQELKTMQNRRAAEQAQARDAAARAKVQQEYQAKTAELQKQHQAEKQQLTQRHKQDTAQVKKAAQQPPKRQPAKNEKPKHK